MDTKMQSVHAENGTESREEEFKDWVGRGCVPIKTYFKKQAARLWAVVCLLYPRSLSQGTE